MIRLHCGGFRGWMMLRLVGSQVESLFDEVLPAGVCELPPETSLAGRLSSVSDGVDDLVGGSMPH
jgi:hypothetical protein